MSGPDRPRRATPRGRGPWALLALRLTLAPLLLGATAWPAAATGATAHATVPQNVYLEELTSAELGDALAAGRTTVIVPVGGTEQSGPHLALGKHNVRATVLAGRIAEALGNAVVAPVVAYVPEGRIAPPTGHMRFPGTISISDAAFAAVLEGAAQSLGQHGFRDIVLLGDHGGYQAQLRTVATKLNRAWGRGGARAHFIAAYYDAAQAPYARLLRAKGVSDAAIGTHAGTADTALMLAVDPARVRPERFADAAARGAAAGVEGDPRPATAALGQMGVDLVVSSSVAAIRAAVASPR